MATPKKEFLGESNAQLIMTLLKAELLKYVDKDTLDTAIKDAMKNVSGLTFEKVDELPETGESSIIYLLPDPDATEKNVYIEYFWDVTNEAFEPFGTTTVDLSGYLKEDDVVEIKNSVIQTLWDATFASTETEEPGPSEEDETP